MHNPPSGRRALTLTSAVAAAVLALTLTPGASWATGSSGETPTPSPTDSATTTRQATSAPETTPPADATPTPQATPSSGPEQTAVPQPEKSAAPVTPPAVVADDGVSELSSKPYMGWSSYSMQVYSGNGKWITADQITAQSDAMHDKLQDFGYEYINVDAGWNDGVDDYGRPLPSATLYPDGLDAVIDHVHANGQKFGLYLIPGVSLQIAEAAYPIHNAPGCTTNDILKRPLQQGDYWGIGYRLDFSNPCSQKYIDSIADLLGEWGVDFLKFDSVTPGSGVSDLSLDARDDVAAWSQALKRNGIWFELSWAVDINYADYWKQYADGWRVDWDVECYCEKEALTTWDNIARLFPRTAEWWRHGGPAGWNDLDSLNVGNGTMDGLTRDERRTATTLWAMSAAPMYLGNDLTNLDEFGLKLLTNPEVIAVDQAGVPAQPVSTATKQQVWYSLNTDGTYTVALYNLGRTEADVTASFSDFGLTGSATVRDLWAGKNLGGFDGSFTAEDVPIHGVRLLTVTPAKKSKLAVNDDSLRVAYDGQWTRNGGAEVAATTQPFTVAVTDTPGGGQPNPPETGRTVTVNDNAPGITYTGNWGYSNNRGLGDHADDVHYAEANGAFFEYAFQGTGIDFVTEKHESQGDVDIYLDGQFVQTVSTYLDPAQGRGVQQTVFRRLGPCEWKPHAARREEVGIVHAPRQARGDARQPAEHDLGRVQQGRPRRCRRRRAARSRRAERRLRERRGARAGNRLRAQRQHGDHQVVVPRHVAGGRRHAGLRLPRRPPQRRPCDDGGRRLGVVHVPRDRGVVDHGEGPRPGHRRRLHRRRQGRDRRHARRHARHRPEGLHGRWSARQGAHHHDREDLGRRAAHRRLRVHGQEGQVIRPGAGRAARPRMPRTPQRSEESG
ncbi:alpha-galactosidase [Microbacterium natoriense]|uniref:Alpha-galactosidase n=1 Tax=Microbacterium natoriense TaxID=284570 RepID=A0AAW8ERY9_9MICO|nr:alpha-galactosidase [Microbacterium natoriense]